VLNSSGSRRPSLSSVSFTAVHHCSQLTAPAASVQVADGDEPP
jgi:hypothetical protein